MVTLGSRRSVDQVRPVMLGGATHGWEVSDAGLVWCGFFLYDFFSSFLLFSPDHTGVASAGHGPR